MRALATVNIDLWKESQGPHLSTLLVAFELEPSDKLDQCKKVHHLNKAGHAG